VLLAQEVGLKQETYVSKKGAIYASFYTPYTPPIHFINMYPPHFTRSFQAL